MHIVLTGRNKLYFKLAENINSREHKEVSKTSNYYLRERRPKLINFVNNNVSRNHLNNENKYEHHQNKDNSVQTAYKILQIRLQDVMSEEVSDHSVDEHVLSDASLGYDDLSLHIFHSDTNSDISSLEGDQEMAVNQGLMAAFRHSTFNGLLHNNDAAP